MTIGAEVIVDSFVRHGCERLFVYPGGTIAPILDQAKNRGLNIFCARHEQGAGYAALAVSRLRQQPQVVMVTSGPGVTNLITTVADAYYDNTPLIVITGQVGTGDLKRDLPLRQRGFQEVDSCALMAPVTKAQFLVEHQDDLARVMEEAFHIASSGRFGPVLIDMPMNVQRGELSSPAVVPSFSKSDQQPNDLSGVEQLAQWLSAAQRPIIVAGQGVLLAQAHEELHQLATTYGIPVSHSLLGLGAMPSDSELALGFHGHTGNQYAGKAIHNSDLVIAVGSRLDVRQTGNQFDRFAPGAHIVRIDLDANEAKHGRVRTDLLINSDAKAALTALLQAMKKFSASDRSAWRQQISVWRQEYALSYDRYGKLKPQQVVESADRLSRGQRVIALTGVGAHQHWVARHFSFDYPQRILLTSGGHGAMGYDLPSAVGAQMYDKDALVLCFVGDGSFQMNIQELGAVVEQELPVKIIVLDNHRLGIVSQFQNFNWQDDPTTGKKWNPDFAAIAQGYGIRAFTVSDNSSIEATLQEAFAHKGPALIHCVIDEEEDITPMLLAGQTLDGMWPYVK
jgi:acetolactate synthase-1/2/3 large subunit